MTVRMVYVSSHNSMKPIEDYELDTPPQSPTESMQADIKPSSSSSSSHLHHHHSSSTPSPPLRCRLCDRDIPPSGIAGGVRQSMSQLGLTPSDDGKEDSVTFCSLKCYYMFVATAKVALSPEQLGRAESHVDEATYTRLKQISADSFARCIQQGTVRVKQEPVFDRRSFPSVLPLLTDLPEHLTHLKRINGDRVIVSPSDSDDELPNLEEYGNLSEIVVPAMKPLSRRQFDWAKDIWPVSFHPNKDLETMLSANEDLETRAAVAACLDVFRSGRGSCVVVRRGQRVAEGIQGSGMLSHASMRAVRALSNTYRTAMNAHRQAAAAASRKRPAPGGAPNIDETASASTSTSSDSTPSKPLPPLDYLATGADVFLRDEPCAMCAMALVHARAARVFFARRTTNGVLARRETSRLGCLVEESGWQLHLESVLNHHYRVFEVQVHEEDAQSNGEKAVDKEEEGEEKRDGKEIDKNATTTVTRKESTNDAPLVVMIPEVERCGAVFARPVICESAETSGERRVSISVDDMDRGAGARWEDEGEDEDSD